MDCAAKQTRSPDSDSYIGTRGIAYFSAGKRLALGDDKRLQLPADLATGKLELPVDIAFGFETSANLLHGENWRVARKFESALNCSGPIAHKMSISGARLCATS